MRINQRPFWNKVYKVVTELRVVQFWSEIILTSYLLQIELARNHTYDFRPNCTPLSSINIINSTLFVSVEFVDTFYTIPPHPLNKLEHLQND